MYQEVGLKMSKLLIFSTKYYMLDPQPYPPLPSAGTLTLSLTLPYSPGLAVEEGGCLVYHFVINTITL